MLSPEDNEVGSIPRLTLWSAGFPTNTLGVDLERGQAGRGPGRWCWGGCGIDRAGAARSEHSPAPHAGSALLSWEAQLPVRVAKDGKC